MTYNVFSGMLNPTHSLTRAIGLASSFLHPPPDSWWKGLFSIYTVWHQHSGSVTWKWNIVCWNFDVLQTYTYFWSAWSVLVAYVLMIVDCMHIYTGRWLCIKTFELLEIAGMLSPQTIARTSSTVCLNTLFDLFSVLVDVLKVLELTLLHFWPMSYFY